MYTNSGMEGMGGGGAGYACTVAVIWSKCIPYRSGDR